MWRKGERILRKKRIRKNWKGLLGETGKDYAEKGRNGYKEKELDGGSEYGYGEGKGN